MCFLSSQQTVIDVLLNKVLNRPWLMCFYTKFPTDCDWCVFKQSSQQTMVDVLFKFPTYRDWPDFILSSQHSLQCLHCFRNRMLNMMLPGFFYYVPNTMFPCTKLTAPSNWCTSPSPTLAFDVKFHFLILYNIKRAASYFLNFQHFVSYFYNIYEAHFLNFQAIILSISKHTLKHWNRSNISLVKTILSNLLEYFLKFGYTFFLLLSQLLLNPLRFWHTFGQFSLILAHFLKFLVYRQSVEKPKTDLFGLLLSRNQSCFFYKEVYKEE